jgi:hypothetical protein
MSKITKEMQLQLQADLPSEAISQHPTKKFLSSIKSIYVTERLNDVFGVGAWQVKTEVIEKIDLMVVVKVTLLIPEFDVHIEQFGGNDNGGRDREGQISKNFDLGDAYKGAVTDAITKIASYLGVGLSVFQGKATKADGSTPNNSYSKTFISSLKTGKKKTGEPWYGFKLNAEEMIWLNEEQFEYMKPLSVEKQKEAAEKIKARKEEEKKLNN